MPVVAGSAARARRPDRNAASDSVARRRHERFGRWAEAAAALALMLKGYRILARRHRTRYGEIDLIAVRGQRLAFVEVKGRNALSDAQDTIGGRQIARIATAAESWVWKNPRYREHQLGLDAMLVGRWRWPQHCPDALHG